MKNVRFKWNKDNRSWWQRMPANGKICAIVCAVCLCAILTIGYFVKMSSDPKTIIYTVLALAFFLIFFMGVASAFSSLYTALKVGEVSDDVALATKNDYAHGYAEGKLAEGSDDDEYLDLDDTPDDKLSNSEPLPQTSLSKERLDELHEEMDASRKQGTDEMEKMLLRRYLKEIRNGMPDEKVKEIMAILNSTMQESNLRSAAQPAKPVTSQPQPNDHKAAMIPPTTPPTSVASAKEQPNGQNSTELPSNVVVVDFINGIRVILVT